MRQRIIHVILFILLTSAFTTSAQQHLTNIGNFVTSNGDTIYNCTIGYRTHGKLAPDSGNVIIYPTWFGGTSEHINGLIGPEKLVDDTEFYIIVFDALSNGVSSSPSNYKGPNAFPDITINDMVKSQHYLLKNVMGLDSIYGVIGGSMGGMQAFEWVTEYPDYIKKAVSYVSTPRPTSYDLLQWNIRLEIIDSYRKLGAEDSQIWKLLDMQSSLLARSPAWLVENIDQNEFETYMLKFDGIHKNIFTLDNYRSQLVAMISHNIFRHYNNSIEETVNTIKANMLVMVNKTDHLVNPIAAQDFAANSDTELVLLDNNSGHLGIGVELKYCGKTIREFFRK